MAHDQHENPDGLEIRVPQDEDYRTCSDCGADCEPEPFTTDAGIRIGFACPEHGVHTVVDPFEGSR
ncbi:MAG TPA: hypothetical protein VK039_09835, partial [Brevibacterium sp.]|nr:hypothetical protein [Brevibacterium sp.]